MKETEVWDIASRLMPQSALEDDAYHEAFSPHLRRVYSIDAFTEGTHFDLKWQSLQQIGWRCLTASLSDLAACGANPLGYLVSLVLPEEATVAEVKALYQGFEEATNAFSPSLSPSFSLWGGDTVKGQSWILSLTVIGEVESHVQLKRSSAQAGNYIIATGSHGLAGLGCFLLQKKADTYAFPTAMKAFYTPVAHIQAGRVLADSIPEASLMDTSDGLADAALKCADASGLHFILEEERLVIHPELVQASERFPDFNALTTLLYGGEDFELLASVPQTSWLKHRNDLEACGFQVIGMVEAVSTTSDIGASLQDESGKRKRLSYQHTFQHFISILETRHDDPPIRR